jgi:hypothetical protein
MKTNLVFIGLLSMVVATASAGNLNVDTIATYLSPGPPTFPILKIIKNVNQLDSYFVATRYDTTVALSIRPDFASQTVISLLTMTGGGNKAQYRKLMRVVDNVDTVFLEFKPDSQVFETVISIQAASHVLLFAIPKTNKPIVLREASVTAARNAFQRIPENHSIGKAPCRFYTLRGQSLTKLKGHTGGLFIVQGERNNAKAIILQRREKF